MSIDSSVDLDIEFCDALEVPCDDFDLYNVVIAGVTVDVERDDCTEDAAVMVSLECLCGKCSGRLTTLALCDRHYAEVKTRQSEGTCRVFKVVPLRWSA